MGEPAAVGWAFIVPSTSSPVKQSYRNGKQPFLWCGGAQARQGNLTSLKK